MTNASDDNRQPSTCKSPSLEDSVVSFCRHLDYTEPLKTENRRIRGGTRCISLEPEHFVSLP